VLLLIIQTGEPLFQKIFSIAQHFQGSHLGILGIDGNKSWKILGNESGSTRSDICKGSVTFYSFYVQHFPI
jgi:hypothetical protein